MESAYITRTSSLINYIRLHILSLEQDLEDELYLFRTNRDNHDSSKIDYLNGQIVASMHLLSVVHDILSTNERNNINESGRHWTPATFTTFG